MASIGHNGPPTSVELSDAAQELLEGTVSAFETRLESDDMSAGEVTALVSMLRTTGHLSGSQRQPESGSQSTMLLDRRLQKLALAVTRLLVVRVGEEGTTTAAYLTAARLLLHASGTLQQVTEAIENGSSSDDLEPLSGLPDALPGQQVLPLFTGEADRVEIR